MSLKSIIFGKIIGKILRCYGTKSLRDFCGTEKPISPTGGGFSVGCSDSETRNVEQNHAFATSRIIQDKRNFSSFGNQVAKLRKMREVSTENTQTNISAETKNSLYNINSKERTRRFKLNSSTSTSPFSFKVQRHEGTKAPGNLSRSRSVHFNARKTAASTENEK